MTIALALLVASAGQVRIVGITYDAPALYLDDRWADKTGKMLVDTDIGRDKAVIFNRAHHTVITFHLPDLFRIDRVVVHCHRYNDNYRLKRVRLEIQQAGVWVPADEKPGFVMPYDAQHRDFDIQLGGRGMVTDTLRLVFAASAVLAISEVEVFGGPAKLSHTALLADRPPAPKARVVQLDADGDGKLDLVLENPFVRLVISPSRGGVVRSFVHHATGFEMVFAQAANFGLLREQLWKPRYFFADLPAAADKGTAKAAAWAETRITGAGGMMSFTHSRKRIALRDDSPVALVEWEIANDPSSMTDYEYGPWMHNWVGRAGLVTHYFVPTVEGVKEFTLKPGALKDQVNLWYWQPARGWMAAVSEGAPGDPPAGLAFVVPYRNLACFYHWAGRASPAATAEWRHGLVKLAAGQSFTARYLVVPFYGLRRVDGVCMIGLRSPDEVTSPDAIPPVVIGAIELSQAGGTAKARVEIFNPPDLKQPCTAVVRWREYPSGQWRELGRAKLGEPWPGGRRIHIKSLERFDGVTRAFDGPVPGATGKAIVVACQLVVGGKVVGEFERFANLSAAHVVYRLKPLEKRLARVETKSPEGLARHDLVADVATPHVAWARPYINGPIRALVLCDDENAREVVELAQRLEMKFTYIKFRTTWKKEWVWHGDRSIPSLEAAQKRLLKALDQDYDVAIIAGFDWQHHFTPEIRSKLAAKVRAGMGLVAIMACSVPADDPLSKALGVSSDKRYTGRYFTWAPAADHYVTRGLWWKWDEQAFSGLLPKTRRMAYRQWPSGTAVATYAEDGRPLISVSRVGRGRVVAVTYDVLTHNMSYRGYSSLTPIISYRGKFLLDEYERMTWPYWEQWWVLLTRMAVWAAGKEATPQVEGLAATVDTRGHVVARLRVGQSQRPLTAVLQLCDRWGVPITGGSQDAHAARLALGPWSADEMREASADRMNLLAVGARTVQLRPGQEISVDLGPARAGWNFVRVVVRDGKTGAAVDWGMTAVRYDVPAAIEALEPDRDPVTDTKLLVSDGQPWARIFAPQKPLALTVRVTAGQSASAAGLRLRAELYDCHGRLLFRDERPLTAPTAQFSFLPTELRNFGLEWRVALMAGVGSQARIIDTARRRIVALPPRVWRRFTFTSWGVNFLTQCRWLQPFLMPLAEELGINVSLTSGTELLAGKVYDAKWHNMRHSYIGLLDYPGRGIPGFRDKKFAEKAAKYAETKKKEYLVREPCLNDPSYRQKLAAGLRERIKEAGGVGFSYDYCMGDEMSLTYYTRYFDYCFSQHCLAAFRRWLRKRYSSLAELNEAWETKFITWDKVMPMTLDEAKHRPNAAPWGEFRTFMNDTVADFFSFVQETIRSVDPEAKCGLSGTQEPKPGNGMDWWKLSHAFSYYHSYNTGWSNEMRRSFARATGVMQTPYYAGYWQRGRRLEYNMFWCLLHDTKGISCWKTALLIYPDFTLTEAGADTRRFVHELRDGLWDLVRAGERINDGIAIHYSQASINAALLMDHDSHIVKVRDAWVRLIEDMGLQYDFVASEEIEKGELVRRGYKVLVLPESIALSPDEIRRIREFAFSGGTVVADGWCGLCDEKCRWHQEPPSDDTFGIGRSAERPAGDVIHVSGWLTGKPVNLRMRPAETEIEALAQPVADCDGVPCLVTKRLGKGRAWYLNIDMSSWPLDRTQGSPNEAALRHVIAAIFAKAGVKPQVRVTMASGKPAHVEVVRYRLADAQIIGLLRDRDDQDTERVAVTLAAPAHLYDLRSHKYLGRRDRLTFPMAPGECRLLLASPAKLAPPSLSVQEAHAQRGGQVRVQVRAGGPCPRLIRLEVLGPRSRLLADYSRNLLVGGQPVQVAFRTALNDPPGRWTIRATDIATGDQAAAEVQVQ